MQPIDTKSRSVRFQYLAAAAANLLTLSHGCGNGWLSPALPLLQSAESPLASGALTVEDVSWIGSILFLGSLLGNFLMGYLVTKIGSKYAITLLGIPQLTAWFLMIFGNRAIYLYFARFLVGLAGGGVEICCSLFISEIADNHVRGKLGTIYSCSRNFGIFFAFILGSYFDYILTAKIFIGVLIAFYSVFAFFPRSPQDLLRHNNVEKAENSFKFYKGYNHKNESKSYFEEFEQIKYASQAVKEEPKFKLRDIFEPNTRKGIILAIIFPILIQFSGSYIILTYGSTIIEKSGTHLSVEISTVSLAISQILGSWLTLQLVDKTGRKFLLILSCFGCMIGHTTIVIYLYLNDSGIDTSAFHIVPVISIAFVVFIAAVGVNPLAILCLIETFPTSMRSIGVTFGGVSFNVISFWFIKAFPFLIEMIELKGCLLICAIGSGFGIVFFTLFISETKGKDLNTILKSQRPTP